MSGQNLGNEADENTHIGHAGIVKGMLQDYYPDMLETAHVGIWMLDADMRTCYVNACMASFLGSTVEEMHLKPFSDFLFEDDNEDGRLVDTIKNATGRLSYECRYKQTGTAERWLKVTIIPAKASEKDPCTYIAMHTDITSQKKTEDALQKSRENMGLIVDSVRDYAILMVDKDRRVMTWNNGAREIFGYTEQEIIGNLSDILFTPEDNSNHVPELELKTALETGHSFDDRWHLRKDGSTFYASGVMTRLSKNGESPLFVKIARDWTERKKLEEMLKNADRHKNEFLATLAHELRNPLASILSGIEVLKQTRDDNNIEKTRAIIERQVQQMIHLVNDLLDISRISLGKIKLQKQDINLIDAVHLALETARPIIEGYKHALTVSLPAGPLIVNGDMTRLSQVFLNILINSAKYTPQKGKIIFTVQPEANEVVITLRDNGMGIPPQMLSTIFEIFEQIQDRSEYPQAGLGIGLSVVKQLVEMHDGKVEAYSEGPNKGSEFTVRLPLVSNPETEVQKDDTLLQAPDEQPAAPVMKKILLVDDNTDAADMLEILLKKKGYLIKKAYNGKTAITTAIEFDPEIILLDLGLPDMNGYEVLNTLKNKLGKRYYLALSGWGQEEDLQRSKDAGFDHHLVKPIDIQSLQEVLSLLN